MFEGPQPVLFYLGMKTMENLMKKRPQNMLIFYAEFMLNNSEAKRSLRFFETNPWFPQLTTQASTC